MCKRDITKVIVVKSCGELSLFVTLKVYSSKLHIYNIIFASFNVSILKGNQNSFKKDKNFINSKLPNQTKFQIPFHKKRQLQDFFERTLVLTTNQSKHGSQKRMDAFSKVQFNFLPFFPSFPFFFDRE